MTRTIGLFPPAHLGLARVQNGAPGLADIPRTLAGNSATLKGLISGGATVGSANAAPNPTPRNWSGDFGHDHSGGYFGRPLLRSIATVHLGQIAASSIAGATLDEVQPPTAGADATTRSLVRGPSVWVPPCDPHCGAYRELGVTIRVEIVSTSLEAGDVLTVGVIDYTTTARERLARADLVILDRDSTGVRVAESGAGAKLRAIPGALNSIGFLVSISRDGTAGDRTATVRLLDLELGVFES